MYMHFILFATLNKGDSPQRREMYRSAEGTGTGSVVAMPQALTEGLFGKSALHFRLRRNPPCGYAAPPLCKGGKV